MLPKLAFGAIMVPFQDKKQIGRDFAYGGPGRTEIPADDRGLGMAGGRMWRKIVWTFFPMWLLLK